MTNYLEREYTYSSSNTASMKNLFETISNTEKDLLNDICKIPYINKGKDLDLNKIENFIDNIDNKEIKNNVFTLFFINYLNESKLKKQYNDETSIVFKLIDKYELNYEYIHLINLKLFSNKLDCEKTLNLTNLFTQLSFKNQNLEQFDFMLKTFDNNEMKEYFNNYVFIFRQLFIKDISLYKEYFNKLVELEFINPNSIQYKDYIYNKEIVNSHTSVLNPIENIQKTTLLNSLCAFKPMIVDKNALDSFKYLYSQGYDLNDSLKIDNYYKKLIKNIDEAYINIKTNKYNLNDFIKQIPKIYDSISKNKNLSLEEKSSEMLKKSEEINVLIKKYDDVIKLGELKEIREENLTLQKDKKSLESIREL